MKVLSIAGLVLTMALAAVWAGQALYDWEWTRALWMSMAFVAAEMALIGVLVLRRLREILARLDRQAEVDLAVARRLAESRPATDHFAWLRDTVGRPNVFVTMVVGGGLLVSGALWVVDKIAGRTVVPAGERHLVADLADLRFPVGGFVPPDSALLADDLAGDERDDLALLLTGRSAVGP